jgi:hypothetical protein
MRDNRMVLLRLPEVSFAVSEGNDGFRTTFGPTCSNSPAWVWSGNQRTAAPPAS